MEPEFEDCELQDIFDLITDGTDRQFQKAKKTLQRPDLRVGKTCWRLYGMVNTIQRLIPLPYSELRSQLANEIEQRVLPVFGPAMEEEYESQSDYTEESSIAQNTNISNSAESAGVDVTVIPDMVAADLAVSKDHDFNMGDVEIDIPNLDELLVCYDGDNGMNAGFDGMVMDNMSF
jgi:hypothetical protein